MSTQIPGQQSSVVDLSAARGQLESERVGATALIEALERDWSRIVEAATSVATDDEHDPEGATIAFERAQLETVLERARAHLQELDDALERVGSGSYGICQECGQPIAAGRLEARPFSTTCIDCAGRRR
jgi:RNA polymerase-binding protein DksA